MTRMSPALQLKHVTKMYDKHHGIHDISLSVQRGEVYGFLGPNGAGKSTTINTILDNLRLDSGEITIMGTPHRRVNQVHRQIGYLAGDMTTDVAMNGRQYLKFVARIYGNVDPRRIQMLEKRLKADTSTKIKHLSRGNKQKIGLIAALMHDPDLLILDEPTSGLDPLMQSVFSDLIHEHAERGKTAFISSHVLSEVQSLCHSVAFIRSGTLIHKGNLADLRDTTGQSVSVNFIKHPTTNALQSLRHVSHLAIDGDNVTFLYHGDMNKLVTFFAAHPVTHLEIHEPDLESLFMHYYEERGVNA